MKKRYIILGTIIFILIFIISICFFKNKKEQIIIENKLHKGEFVVYKKYSSKELFNKKGNDFIFKKIGKNKIKRGNKIYFFNVVDVKAPKIMSNTIVVKKGTSLKDALNYIWVLDDYDVDLKKEFIGDYDLNKVGKYKIKFEVSDSSSNRRIAPIVLKVVDKIEVKKNKKIEREKVEYKDFYKKT